MREPGLSDMVGLKKEKSGRKLWWAEPIAPLSAGAAKAAPTRALKA